MFAISRSQFQSCQSKICNIFFLMIALRITLCGCVNVAACWRIGFEYFWYFPKYFFFLHCVGFFLRFRWQFRELKINVFLNAERLWWCAKLSSCDWINFIEQMSCVGFEYYATSIRWHQAPSTMTLTFINIHGFYAQSAFILCEKIYFKWLVMSYESQKSVPLKQLCIHLESTLLNEGFANTHFDRVNA